MCGDSWPLFQFSDFQAYSPNKHLKAGHIVCHEQYHVLGRDEQHLKPFDQFVCNSVSFAQRNNSRKVCEKGF